MSEVETKVAMVEEEKRVVKYSITMAEIAKLEEQYNDVPQDLTVKANYEMVRKAASHLRGLRSDVEKRRKELKADALAWGKLVDGTAKEITERLQAIEEPFATAKKEFDTAEELKKREVALAEERRVDGIAEQIAAIKATVEANISNSSTAIQHVINDINGVFSIAPDWAMEFREKAELVAVETLKKLTELRDMKLQQETMAAQQAEAEARRKIEEEEARRQREAQLQEERAKIEKERQEMEVEKKRMAAAQQMIDAQMAAEKAKMEQEIAALKAAANKPEPVIEVKKEPVVIEPDQQAYKDAGNAMLLIISNKRITKTLLDSIIEGEIPYIQFTGDK